MTEAYFALKAIRRHMYHRGQFNYPFWKTARALLRELPILVANAPRTAIILADVMLNPVLTRHNYCLETNIEPVPNPDSRVTLGPMRDQLGLNRVQVDWRLTEQDREHYLKVNTLLVEDLTKSGVITSSAAPADPAEFWPKNIIGCWHHMGTTRMHADPARGVVDADCKVHGMSNLFIAGSSVFPTVGNDFPTITIVALALRLSAKLEAALEQERAATSRQISTLA